MEPTYQPGDRVLAEYRSGLYAGELVSVDRPKAKVRVLAVMKHPTQGDLHHAYEANVPIFHERRALSNLEVCNVWLRDVRPLEGAIPDYRTSLVEALGREEEAVRSMASQEGYQEWAKKALERLNALRRDYVE